MKEHHDWQTNIHLIRQLFATIIAKCEVNKHKTFYKTCKNYLHIDFLHTYKVEFPKNPFLQKYIGNNTTIESDDEVSLLDEDVVEDNMIVLETYEDDDEWTLEKFASNSSLCDLEQILAKEDLSLKDFDLPVPNMKKEEFIQNHLQDHRDIAEENDLSVEKANMFYEANYPLLNKDQQDVFNYIKDLIVGKNKDGLLVFLDAPGGTGKTVTLNVLVTWMIKEDLKVAISAASGIAATLLFLGQTTHHRFKLPLTPHKYSVCNLKKESEIGRFLSEISLGIIDEGPMLNKLYLEALDRSLKDLVPAEDKEKKFGGKIILVSSDFRQLLPVLEKASTAEIVNHTLKNSVTLWDNKVIKLQLRQNMWVRKEMEKFPHDKVLHEELQTHEQFLLDLGEGKLLAHATVDGYNLIEIPSSMCQTSKEEMIEKVFDDFQSHIGNMEYFQGRVLLATTNKIVDEVNEEMVERIPGDLHTFHSIDTVTDIDNSTMFPTEFLNSLNLSGLPEHTLKLKKILW